MPGLRAMPAVISTTSLFSVSSYDVVPTIWASDPMMGSACRRSRALPLGMPPVDGWSTQDDIAEFHGRTPVSGCGTDVARSNNGNLCAPHAWVSCGDVMTEQKRRI